MDATSEYRGVTEIRKTLRRFLNDSLNVERPKEEMSCKRTLPSFNHLHHIRNQPQLAQLDANEDARVQQLDYEEMVMLHSGYAPQGIPQNVELVSKALNTMTKIPLLSLPAEIRATIWDYALSFN